MSAENDFVLHCTLPLNNRAMVHGQLVKHTDSLLTSGIDPRLHLFLEIAVVPMEIY